MNDRMKLRPNRSYWPVDVGLAGFGFAGVGATGASVEFEAGPPPGAILLPDAPIELERDEDIALSPAGAPLVAFGFAGVGLLGSGTVGDALCAIAVPPNAKAAKSPAAIADCELIFMRPPI
jgi:hypothetical protein